MPQRLAIEVDRLPHRSPIPAAARIGPVVWSSPVSPVDPSSGHVPDALAAQVQTVFSNIGLVLTAAGLTYDAVGKLEFWLADKADRSVLNEVWLRYFPDETTRPARQVQESTALPDGVRLMATFQAWAGD